MSKELEYEINNFANLLHKDCMNLMEVLKKQDKDNKAILYVGRHFKKVILPYEEYQKMCNRLESIDNAVKICEKANEQKYVYIKETYGIIKEKFLDDLDYEVLNNRLYVNSRGMYYDFHLKDYGNWWALTKEELEHE